MVGDRVSMWGDYIIGWNVTLNVHFKYYIRNLTTSLEGGRRHTETTQPYDRQALFILQPPRPPLDGTRRRPGRRRARRSNLRLMRSRDVLTWCFDACSSSTAVHDTLEASPLWRSGESRWKSAHPWAAAGRWPWLPSNQPLKWRETKEILRLQRNRAAGRTDQRSNTQKVECKSPRRKNTPV